MTVFLLMTIGAGYAAAYYFGNPVILYIVAGLAVLTNIGSYWFSDKLVLRMTNAHPAEGARYRELRDIVENLSITAGLPMPKVYVVNDAAPNAFATGRNPEHAVVAVTTGLLGLLDRAELEGVIAHELAHVGNRDMLVMTVAVVLAGFIAILSDMIFRTMMFGGSDNRNRNAFAIGASIVGILLATFAAQLMQMAISRKREFLADASGALLTRYPEGLASALEKISGAARPMQRASTATAHLFIADPFAGTEQTLWQRIGNLFQTHPPASERIARLRGMNH